MNIAAPPQASITPYQAHFRGFLSSNMPKKQDYSLEKIPSGVSKGRRLNANKKRENITMSLDNTETTAQNLPSAGRMPNETAKDLSKDNSTKNHDKTSWLLPSKDNASMRFQTNPSNSKMSPGYSPKSRQLELDNGYAQQIPMIKITQNRKSTMPIHAPNLNKDFGIERQGGLFNTEKRKYDKSMMQGTQQTMKTSSIPREIDVNITVEQTLDPDLSQGLCLQPNANTFDTSQLKSRVFDCYKKSLDDVTNSTILTNHKVSYRNNPNLIQQVKNNQMQINKTVHENDVVYGNKQRNFFNLESKSSGNHIPSFSQMPNQKCNTATIKNVDSYSCQNIFKLSNAQESKLNSGFKNKKRHIVNNTVLKGEKYRHMNHINRPGDNFNLSQFKQYINQLLHADHRRHYQDKLNEVHMAQQNINKILRGTGLISNEGRKHNQSQNSTFNSNNQIKTKSEMKQHQYIDQNFNSAQSYNSFVEQQTQIKSLLREMFIPKEGHSTRPAYHGISTLTQGLSQLNDIQLNELLHSFFQEQLQEKHSTANIKQLEGQLGQSMQKQSQSLKLDSSVPKSKLLMQPQESTMTDDELMPFKKGFRKSSVNETKKLSQNKFNSSIKTKQDPGEIYQQFKNSQQSIKNTTFKQNKHNVQYSETNIQVEKQEYNQNLKPQFVQSKIPVCSSSNVTRRKLEKSNRLLSPQPKEDNKKSIESSRYNSIDARILESKTQMKTSKPSQLELAVKLNRQDKEKKQKDTIKTVRDSFMATDYNFIKKKESEISKQLMSYPDFDIEYAKLIAKQFPIYDENGRVIDYSNINEYQLELLALHEEYGEEKDLDRKTEIFNLLQQMCEKNYFDNKDLMSSKAMKQHLDISHSIMKNQTRRKQNQSKTENKKPAVYGQNVGTGGNPNYKKNVIQLEQERIEKERQELILKRKRNSNYIQKCIKLGNDHYSHDKLSQLNWMKKGAEQMADQRVKIDDKNYQILKKKQEILAKYNQISQLNKPDDEDVFRYNLVSGNNSNLLRRVFRTRPQWDEMEHKHLTTFHFKWAPVSRFINFELINNHGQKKIVNHLERHDVLSTKDQLYHNMYKFCESQKLNVFQYLPIQFVFDLNLKSLMFEVDRFCQYFNSIENIRKHNEFNNRRSGETLKEINHVIQTNKLINPDIKYKNIISRKYSLDPSMYNNMNVWLIKPNDFNRGRGVMLFNTLEQLRKLLKEYTASGSEIDFSVQNVCSQIIQNEKSQPHAVIVKKPSDDNVSKRQEIPKADEVQDPLNQKLQANVKSAVYVIQKYIERPLLIDDRKFDIRLWVLINMIDLKDIKCYLFKEGYIRTSSYQFELTQQSIDKPLIHLTNNAVQCLNKDYGKHEEGNQLSFSQASQKLHQKGIDLDFYDLLETDIEDVVEMTLRCVESQKLNPNQRKNTFEIMGYDFMIDEYMKPWLIEVNTNPCLEETSKLLKKILPRMLDDTFKITLDPAFPNYGADGSKPKQHFEVDGFDDNENLWKHIYTMKPQ